MPVDPENGGVSFDRLTLGGIATFVCEDDFRLEGDESRVCELDGEWSGEEPICI